jgi:hypothetical protein
MASETPAAHHSQGYKTSQHPEFHKDGRKHLRQRARNQCKPRNRQKRSQTIKSINRLPRKPRYRLIRRRHRRKSYYSKEKENNRQRPIARPPAQNLRRDPRTHAPQDETDRVARTKARKDEILAPRRPAVDMPQRAHGGGHGGRAAEAESAV